MSSQNNITAVILCGGQGTRLRSVLPEGMPKVLAPVAGRPFLSYIFDHLADQGIRKVVLCVRDKDSPYWIASRRIAFGSNRPIGIVTSWEKEPLGTGGALRNALPLLDSDPVLVLNGDTFCKFKLEEMLRAHEDRELMLTYWGYFRPRGSGVLLASKEFIDWLDPKYSLEKNIEWALNSGEWSSVGPKDPEFVDIGTPEGYASAEAFLREQGVIK